MPDKTLSGVAAACAFINAVFIAGLAVAIPRNRHLLGDGRPPVTPGIPPLESALLRAPALSLLFTMVMIGICVFAWTRRRWSRPGRLYYSILSVGAVLFVAVMVIWKIV